MKAPEIRDLPPAEVSKRLEDARSEMFNLRFQRASGQLKDPNRMRIVKRDIARLLTVLREHEIRTEWEQYQASLAQPLGEPEAQESGSPAEGVESA